MGNCVRCQRGAAVEVSAPQPIISPDAATDLEVNPFDPTREGCVSPSRYYTDGDRRCSLPPTPPTPLSGSDDGALPLLTSSDESSYSDDDGCNNNSLAAVGPSGGDGGNGADCDSVLVGNECGEGGDDLLPADGPSASEDVSDGSVVPLSTTALEAAGAMEPGEGT